MKQVLFNLLLTFFISGGVANAATNTLHDKPLKTAPASTDETYVWDTGTSTLKKTTFAPFLVGDCTGFPCLDGTSDGGNYIKLWAGTGSYWTALQGGSPAANRSWRLPIAAPPAAGTTYLMNMDEYGQMGFAPAVSDAAYGAGWNGDIGAASKNAIYDKIETIAGGSMTYPGAGVPVSTGTAWGTSLAVATAIGETGADTNIPTEQAVREAITALPAIAFGTGLTVAADTPTAGTDTVSITANTYQAYDANMIAWPAAVSATEISYLDGATSNLQDQINAISLGGSFTFDTFPTYEDSTHSSGIAVNGTTLAIYSVTASKWLTVALTDTLDPTPPTDASDDFVTVGPTLGNNWATTTGLGVLKVVENTPNRVTTTSETVSVSYWVGSDLTNNHCSQVTIQATGSGHMAPVVRASAVEDTYYRQLGDQVRSRVAGVDNNITGTGTITAQVVGQVRKLCINGSTLTLYNNGVLEWIGTDTAITTGYAGIRGAYPDDSISNWVGSVAP